MTVKSTPKTKDEFNSHQQQPLGATSSPPSVRRRRPSPLFYACVGTLAVSSLLAFTCSRTISKSRSSPPQPPSSANVMDRHRMSDFFGTDTFEMASDTTSSTVTGDGQQEMVGEDDNGDREAVAPPAVDNQRIGLRVNAAISVPEFHNKAEHPSTGKHKSQNSGSAEILPEMPADVHVPFFGRNDRESTREMASHLDHLLEEYRQDLARVVQRVDVIIHGLEEQAAKSGGKRSRESRDMPPEGTRRLAAKLRRKLAKTPPRWQVNIDVLAWLLRPVPFVTGLPAPISASTVLGSSGSGPSTPSAAKQCHDEEQPPCEAASNNNNIIGTDHIERVPQQETGCASTAALAPKFNTDYKAAESRDPGGGGGGGTGSGSGQEIFATERVGSRTENGVRAAMGGDMANLNGPTGSCARSDRLFSSSTATMENKGRAAQSAGDGSPRSMEGGLGSLNGAAGAATTASVDAMSLHPRRSQHEQQPHSPTSGAVDPYMVNEISSAELPATSAVEERRAFPVHTTRRGEGVRVSAAGGDGAEAEEGGRERTFNRTGFHAYDEIHQIFTHILRDWTAEGNSVRAAVYDPLLRALDLYVGWQQLPDAAASRSSPVAFGPSAGGRRAGETGVGWRGSGAGWGPESSGRTGSRSGGTVWEQSQERYERRCPRRAKKARRMANVLVPGAGLGRLAVEVAARGYASVHANELSPTMLASCYWLMDALRGDDFPMDCSGSVEIPTFSSMSQGEQSGESEKATTERNGGGGVTDSRNRKGKGKGRWSPPPAADRMADRDGDETVEEKEAGVPRRSGDDGTEDEQELGATGTSSRPQHGAYDAAEATGVGSGIGGTSWGGRGGGSSGGWGRAGAAEDEVENGESADSEGRRTRGRGGSERTEFCEFYPFLNDAPHNEMDGEARFRPVLFPDLAGRSVLTRASGCLSFQAGEFSATYGVPGGPFEGTFDAVVTSFFLDTAPNVVEYVATIRRTMRPGGVWINCGPLHWHKQSALALSLDEMLALVVGSGFRLEAVERLPPCSYRVTADSARSLRVDEFKPVFWVAVLEGTYTGN